MRFLMPNATLKFYYDKGITIEVKNRSFKEAIQFIFDLPGMKIQSPLKMVAISTGKQFYFDKERFQAFLDDEYSQRELLEATQCDGLFRNKVDLVCGGIEIDHYSLWKLVNKKFVLIDAEQNIAVMSPDDNFIEV